MNVSAVALSPSRPSRPDAEWISRYEELRRHAVGEQVDSVRGVGMAVLIRRGMAAWLDACSRCSPRVDLQAAEPGAGSSTVPQELRNEITEVLTSMVLSCGEMTT